MTRTRPIKPANWRLSYEIEKAHKPRDLVLPSYVRGKEIPAFNGSDHRRDKKTHRPITLPKMPWDDKP